MGSTSAPPSKFKVALIQMRPKPNDLEFNFTQAATQIRKAVSQSDVSLAILPEYHLTAFEPSSPLFIPCCQTAHPYIQRYQTLAAELNIHICAGTIVLTPEPEDPSVVKYAGTNSEDDDDSSNRPTLLNTSYFISNKGEILGSYTKTNLWHPERDHLTSSIEHHTSQQQQVTPHHKPSAHGESLPSPHEVIQTSLGPIGILICWDIAFPEAFRSLVLQGAKLILLPTFWLYSDMSDEGLAYNKDAERLFLENTLVARAFENTCGIIFCNAGGPRDEDFLGISRAVLPITGVVENSFEGSDEGVRVVEIDMEILEVAERNYKIREDLKKDDWHYGYAK